MTVSAGSVVYRFGEHSCSVVGLRWSDDELSNALHAQVATNLFDDEGKSEIMQILVASRETQFVNDEISRILKDAHHIEQWRVGEAIAQTYLTDHRSCEFPWPVGRDEKRPGSSMPGADLVGIGNDDSGECLVFGEVKTSSQNTYPPSVMHGRTGLKKQLESLCSDESIRDGLVKYLGHRAVSSSWETRFKRAVARYMKSSSDIQLYGYLIRDVEPRVDDLKVRVCKLCAIRPSEMRIELLALYLPSGSLRNAGKEIVSHRKMGRK